MQQFLRRRYMDGLFFVILMALLGGFAILLHINPIHPSGQPHYIIQAEAWLHGRLDMGFHINDSIVVNGKYYIIYPPMPSLLMIPFIVVLHSKFSDIWFTWAFAALNIILLFRTLEVMRVHRITSRTALENGIIALTFGFGTVALWLCLNGSVWFTGQIISTFGIMLTLHSTLSRRWSLATLGVGWVLLSRTSEALIGVFPLIVYLHDLGIGSRVQGHLRILPQRWPSLRELAILLLPFVGALLILGVHNKLYFNNFLSSGYDIHSQQDTVHYQYGILSWHYIWPNFVVDFLRWPSFSFTGINDVHPRPDLIVGGIGTSMFFSTPLLAIFLFVPQGKTSQPWLRTTLWITTAVILLSVLCFQAAGANQVGARYVLPLYPLLFLLLAQRAARLDVRWIGLAGLSIFINLLLAQIFWAGYPSKSLIAAYAGAALLFCAVALFLLYKEKQRQNKVASITISVETTSDEEITAPQTILK